ncbi:MAG TPA: hypothetical protein DCW46_02205, partial [Desulfotomaculum sp.]|nr:hypothetical protein [Desulfotomaculum sp.]
LIKFGNRYLRYYFMEATNKVRMYDHELKRFYDLKYSGVFLLCAFWAKKPLFFNIFFQSAIDI